MVAGRQKSFYFELKRALTNSSNRQKQDHDKYYSSKKRSTHTSSVPHSHSDVEKWMMDVTILEVFHSLLI